MWLITSQVPIVFVHVYVHYIYMLYVYMQYIHICMWWGWWYARGLFCSCSFHSSSLIYLYPRPSRLPSSCPYYHHRPPLFASYHCHPCLPVSIPLPSSLCFLLYSLVIVVTGLHLHHSDRYRHAHYMQYHLRYVTPSSSHHTPYASGTRYGCEYSICFTHIPP
jgi:hypothetical protein